MTLLSPTIRRRTPTRVIALRLAAVAVVWVALLVLNEHAWDWAFSALGIDAASSAGGAAHFFLYDAAKILLLLVGMIYAIGLLRTTLKPERVRTFIEGRPLVVALILAAVLGAVTPFCSCSSIPLFIGFVAAGHSAQRRPDVPHRLPARQRGRRRRSRQHVRVGPDGGVRRRRPRPRRR